MGSRPYFGKRISSMVNRNIREPLAGQCTDQRSLNLYTAVETQNYPTNFIPINSNFGNPLIAVFPRIAATDDTERSVPKWSRWFCCFNLRVMYVRVKWIWATLIISGSCREPTRVIIWQGNISVNVMVRSVSYFFGSTSRLVWLKLHAVSSSDSET